MIGSAAEYVRHALSAHGRTEVRIAELVYISLAEEVLGPGEAMALARRAVAITLDTMEDERDRKHMR